MWENSTVELKGNALKPFQKKAMYLTETNGDLVVRTDGEKYSLEFNQ